MNRLQVKKTVFLGVIVVLTGFFVAVFTVPLDKSAPPLGKLLFPGNGIWKVADSYPEAEKHTIKALDSDVRILRDQWGIPHIYGKSQKDIAFALGYVQAEDRLFFMDLARRFARGQLAEIIGKGALGVDIVSKTKLLEHSAEIMYRQIRNSKERKQQEFYEYLESYSKGVNHYVATHSDSLPLEFVLLDYGFKPWTGVDSMAVAYYMMEAAWGYWDIDRFVVLSAFMERFGRDNGLERFVELFGNPAEGKVLPFQIPTNPGYGNYPDISPGGRSMNHTPAHTDDAEDIKAIARSFSGLIDTIEAIPLEDIRKKYAEFSGSNGWAVHGSKTKSGKPLLSSDSHEGWNLPNVYYEAHVVNPSSDYNFYGYYVAGGAGAPIYGHSKYVSYGMTRCQFDQIDWYYYEAAGEDHYIYKGEKRKYKDPIKVSIKVKGKEPVNLEIKRTVHGPVFSALGKHAPKALKNIPASFDSKVIAARWLSTTSPKVKYLGTSLLGMSMARNLDEFRLAMKDFEAPASNISYADSSGNIYMHSTGDFPQRDNSSLPSWHLGNGIFPYNGSRGEGEWKKIVAYDELPHAVNPSEGFLVSSNQIVAGPEYFKKYVGQFRYNHGYRARRVGEMLAGNDNLTSGDMKAIQTDIVSIKARDFLPHLLKMLDQTDGKSSRQQQAYDILSTWPYDMDKDKAAPGIFTAWVDFLYEGTIRDDWKKLKLTTRLQPDYPVLEKLIRTRPDSFWFDDVNTNEKVENADDIMLISFRKALDALEAHFKTNRMDSWKWGEIHQLEFVHMTGELDPLNYGPVPIGGSYETVSAPRNRLLKEGEFKPGRVDHGSHHRMVVDFGDMTKSQSVLPGGNSGHSTMGDPIDQFDLFINGKLKNEYFTAKTPEAFLKLSEKTLSQIELQKKR